MTELSSFASARGIADARAVLTARRIAFITGAGVSTDSGIPDYRGAGSAPRTPMDINAFLTNKESRQRYWAGGHRGFKTFDATVPNASHHAITRFERAGNALGVITQNVDGLHLKAGSQHVVELHGTARNIVCIECGQVFDRREIGARIEATNPWLASAPADELGPDGDSIPDNIEQFVVPECTNCGGVLRPDVVFFGEFIPRERFASAEGMVAAADAIVVAGTSLTVNTPIRLLDRARRRNLPIVIINRGPTKWDSQAAVKIDDGTSATLQALADAMEIA
ncbi:Sir2 family NAD-dependent protein deacetylase [Microbacterium sp. NC79]|uniref:Sir2 family NAD-dependent protein deacetylase n=1 Tax=Microbacterium sp. NC79 TaxID=2851009 RepID=UPI001C2BFF9C|nr:NAD-dependent deacetylase [Microbacterium sp. NC79]